MISDTHLPDYIEEIPEMIGTIFADVDLILHAGDVGLLSVLDLLSKNDTPVIAVLGNDEEIAATRAALPIQQFVSVGNERIFIVHGHRSTPEAEQAMRADDRWEPKFEYLADQGKQHSASIVISGHSHISWVLTHDDILLINPGSVANAGFMMRVDTPTVAILELPSRTVTHYHAKTGTIVNVEFDIAAGFAAVRDAQRTIIVTPELMAQREWLMQQIYPLSPETVRPAIRACAAKCWRDEAEQWGIPDLWLALRLAGGVPDTVFEVLRSNPAFAPYI